MSPGPTTFRAAGDNPATTSQTASPAMAKHGASRHARRHASVRTKPDPANRAHCPTTPRQRLMATHQDTPSLGHAPVPAAPRQPTALPSVCNGRSCLNEICLPAAIVQDRRTLSRPIARGVRQPRDNLTSSVIGHHRRCHVCRRRPARRLGRRPVAPLTALRMPFRPGVAAFRPSRSPARKAGIRTTADRRHRHIEPEPEATHPAAPTADSPQAQRSTGMDSAPPVRTEGTQLHATLVTGG